MEKAYHYYVASLCRWEIVEADNAREALDLAPQTELRNSTILTVRIATKDEVEQDAWHKKMVKAEARAGGNRQ